MLLDDLGQRSQRMIHRSGIGKDRSNVGIQLHEILGRGIPLSVRVRPATTEIILRQDIVFSGSP